MRVASTDAQFGMPEVRLGVPSVVEAALLPQLIGWGRTRKWLLTGDTIFVTPGGDRITFVWSAPNRLPLPEAAVRGIVRAVRPFPFDRIYGGWAPAIRWDARRVLENSARRYIQFLCGEAPG